MPPESQRTLEEEAWETLVDSIVAGECTPFLGAGVAWPHLPTGRQLAIDLAKEHQYPLPDTWNLPRVAQYLATIHEPAFAKRRVVQRLKAAQEAYLETEGRAPENYRLLAQLDLPVYVTTNYDNFLEHALKAHGRDPKVETARWNDTLWDQLEGYPEHTPTDQEPILFHLHGDLRRQASLLLTEDDYIDFTVTLALRSTEQAVLWHRVRRALSQTSLLFVGYSLEDWNFRVLMRYLLKQQRVVRSEQSFSLSIQLADVTMEPESRGRAEKFLDHYLGNSAIRVHWTDASIFLKELDDRVKESRRAAATRR